MPFQRNRSRAAQQSIVMAPSLACTIIHFRVNQLRQYFMFICRSRRRFAIFHVRKLFAFVFSCRNESMLCPFFISCMTFWRRSACAFGFSNAFTENNLKDKRTSTRQPFASSLVEVHATAKDWRNRQALNEQP